MDTPSVYVHVLCTHTMVRTCTALHYVMNFSLRRRNTYPKLDPSNHNMSCQQQQQQQQSPSHVQYGEHQETTQAYGHQLNKQPVEQHNSTQLQSLQQYQHHQQQQKQQIQQHQKQQPSVYVVDEPSDIIVGQQLMSVMEHPQEETSSLEEITMDSDSDMVMDDVMNKLSFTNSTDVTIDPAMPVTNSYTVVNGDVANSSDSTDLMATTTATETSGEQVGSTPSGSYVCLYVCVVLIAVVSPAVQCTEGTYDIMSSLPIGNSSIASEYLVYVCMCVYVCVHAYVHV